MTKPIRHTLLLALFTLATACTVKVPLEPQSFRGCGVGMESSTTQQLLTQYRQLPNNKINEQFYTTVYQIMYDSMSDLNLSPTDHHLAADVMTENYLDCLKNTY